MYLEVDLILPFPSHHNLFLFPLSSLLSLLSLLPPLSPYLPPLSPFSLLSLPTSLPSIFLPPSSLSPPPFPLSSCLPPLSPYLPPLSPGFLQPSSILPNCRLLPSSTQSVCPLHLSLWRIPRYEHYVDRNHSNHVTLIYSVYQCCFNFLCSLNCHDCRPIYFMGVVQII